MASHSADHIIVRRWEPNFCCVSMSEVNQEPRASGTAYDVWFVAMHTAAMSPVTIPAIRGRRQCRFAFSMRMVLESTPWITDDIGEYWPLLPSPAHRLANWQPRRMGAS